MEIYCFALFNNKCSGSLIHVFFWRGKGYRLFLLILEIFFLSLEICVQLRFIIGALGIYVSPMSAIYLPCIFMTIMPGSIISISSSPRHGLISPKRSDISITRFSLISWLPYMTPFSLFRFVCLCSSALLSIVWFHILYITVLSRCMWLAEQILYATVLSNAKLAK
jgi:hypothetical protein